MDPPAIIEVDAGVILSDDKAVGVTLKDAVVDLPLSVADTVWLPSTVAVHEAAVQEPSGAIVKVVAAVASPRLLPYWSNAWVVKACDDPAAIVAGLGEMAMWSSGPGVTVTAAWPPAGLEPEYIAQAVVLPACVEVQTLALQEPPFMLKVTSAV